MFGLDALGDFCSYVKTKVEALLAFFLSPVITVWTIVYGIVQWADQTFKTLLTKIAEGDNLYHALMALASKNLYGALPAPLANAAAFLNYCVPLTELLAVSTLLISFFVVAAGIRWVKGWFPTMN